MKVKIENGYVTSFGQKSFNFTRETVGYIKKADR